MTNFFEKLRDAARKRAEFQRTYNELVALPSTTARDLGIDDKTPRQIAYEAVYGR